MPVDESIEKKELTKPNKSISREDFQNKAEFFKSIIDGMGCGVLSIDSEGVVIKINDIAKKILWLDEEEALEGRHIADLLNKHHQILKLMLESFHMSTLPSREELDISMNGKRKKIGYSISLVVNKDGQKIGSSIFFRDLTKIEEREEQERLQERLAALGHMSASLAHELKNPLGALEINVSFLKRKINDHDETLEIIDGVISDISRLKFIINESLSFVKAIELDLALADITQVIDSALQSVLLKRDLQNIDISKNYEKDLKPFLFDAELFTRVLINIFQNSLDALNNKGSLEVEIRRIPHEGDKFQKGNGSCDPSDDGDEKESIRMTIKDNGEGISQEIINKIFYPFFTTKDKGSGLGLSFAKKVVDAHKGFIDVESEAGSGTTFTIQIPVQDQIED